jgi:hypothetical protein
VKIRFVAAATSVALLLLAACGGSESSTQDSTRTKNAALPTATSATPSPTTAPTTPAPSCATGGACVVGDTGPGGGIVFYAAQTLQPWGQYMEVSKQTLDTRFDTMWCDVMPKEAFPNADALGNGRATSEFYAKPCKRGQLRMVTDLVQGKYDDWHLPTLADAKQMYLVREKLQLEGQWHYTATPNLADGKQEAWAVYMVEEQIMSMNPEAGYAGRAIRTFAPRQAPSCANGDACKVGDIGPGGGVVFYAATTPQPWGQYLEVSQKTLDTRFDTMWCDVVPTEQFPNADALGNGRATTEFYAKPCTRGQLRMATDLAQGGYDDWHLPTLADLKQLFLVSKQLKIEGQWHYSATAVAKDKQAIALYMVDGQVKPMNPLAGFAGRAIRTFGPKGTAPTTLAPTTVPPTTITPTTLAPTTVPAQNASCATGGKCKIGDVGPGGGIVFFAATTPQPWGQYLEAPTKNIASNQFWCDNLSTDIAGAQATAIGDGKQNTIDMDNACKSGAGQAAADFTLGGKDDWYLPSKDELNAMRAQRTLLNMSGYFFSSSEAKTYYAWDQYMADGTPYAQSKNSGRDVRPIRAFGPTGKALATAGSTSQSLPVPTTGPVTAVPKPTVPATTATTLTIPAKPKQTVNTPTTIAKTTKAPKKSKPKSPATTTTVKK